jgi:hypothetical protein
MYWRNPKKLMPNWSDFVKAGSFVIAKSDISLLDCTNLEQLKVLVHTKSGQVILAEDIEALELVMQCKPSMFEGKRLAWPKFVWFVHNVFGHPLTQFFALFKMYRTAFWIHDATVPKPIGRRLVK